MAFTVTLAPEASADAISISRWWKANRPAAPLLFQQELSRALQRLVESPELGSKVRMRNQREARLIILRGSRSLIFYSVNVVEKAVVVTRIRRAQRRPLHRK